MHPISKQQKKTITKEVLLTSPFDAFNFCKHFINAG